MEIGEPIAVLLALVSAVKPKPKPKFHMHFDANRDGDVDDRWLGLAVWNWGKGKRGAICFCNNDSDDSSGATDNADDKVNGGNDKTELAPIVIRKVGKAAAPASWKATLEVVAPLDKRVRIFETRTTGAHEVLGPTKGAVYTFPDLSFTEKELGIEALFYAGEDGGWDGLAVIVFKIEDTDTSTEVYRQTGTMRVAPWMMGHHLVPAEKVFVVDGGPDNSRFRTELAPMVAAAGCSLQQHPQPNDIWMQDCMEIGYTFIPKHHMPVATRAKRNRPLKTFPKTLLKPDFGYEEPSPVPPGPSTFDSNGNLEVTPPCVSPSGKKFPWGRIYFGTGRPGEPFDPDVMRFLHEQKVQRPIHVDTNWLVVGHVDEIISFVPAPGSRGFKLLLASPRRAYELINAAKTAGHGSSKMLTGRNFGGPSAEVSIDTFLSSGIAGLGLSATAIKNFNDQKTINLTAVRTALAADIKLDATDIIEIPILFMPNVDFPTLADAMTAGMVNMLVINRNCIIPKPFGPVVGGSDIFEADVRSKLTPLGLTVKFLDDWFEYHIAQGEIHCGTNTLRRPDPAKWKWWEFEP